MRLLRLDEAAVRAGAAVLPRRDVPGLRRLDSAVEVRVQPNLAVREAVI